MSEVKDSKVMCEICKKELAKSSLRGHNIRFHKVEVTPAPLEQKKNDEDVMMMDDDEEEEEAMLEAAEDMEDAKAADDIEKVEALKAKDKMKPDPKWLSYTMDCGELLKAARVEGEVQEVSRRPNPFSPPRARVPFLAANLPSHLFLVSEKEKIEKVENKLKETEEKLAKVEMDGKKKEKEHVRLFRQHENLKVKYEDKVRQEKNTEEVVKENSDLKEKATERKEEVSKLKKEVMNLEIENAELKSKEEKTRKKVIIDIEEKDEALKCGFCDHEGRNMKDLKGHIKFEHNKCTECPERFFSFDKLQVHLEEKHGIKRFLCSTCKEVLPSLAALEEHCRKEKNKGEKKRGQEKVEKVYECPTCQEKFDSQYAVAKHIDVKHPMEAGLGEFQEVKRGACPFFKRGGCKKKDKCNMSHEMKEVEVCKNGPQCTFLARGHCRYSHGSAAVKEGAQGGQGRGQGALGRGQGGQGRGQGAGQDRGHHQGGQDQRVCWDNTSCRREHCRFLHLEHAGRGGHLGGQGGQGGQGGRRGQDQRGQLCWDNTSCRREHCRFLHLEYAVDFPHLAAARGLGATTTSGPAFR